MKHQTKYVLFFFMCCLCPLIVQFFCSQYIFIAVKNMFTQQVLNISNHMISAAKSLRRETNCVPEDLKYLTTEYSAKLCHPNHLWSHNYSSLQQLTCKYPTLNPFDEGIVRFMGQSVERQLCFKKSTLEKMFSTDYHTNLITIQSPETFGFFNCCYRVMVMKPPENSDFRGAKASRECYPIASTNQQITDEFIQIVCYQNQSQDNKNTSNKETVVDFQTFLPSKTKEGKNVSNLDNQLNIAILGLDAISHMNLIRTMPKSYEYIQQTLKAFGFFGYNSVGDSTFHNMMPLHTGYDNLTLTTTNTLKCPKAGPYDNCPFIWKEFAQKGYHTIFGEDASFLGTYHYSKHGFRKPPTDYYLRPLFLAVDSIFGPGYYDFPCWAGPRLYFEYLLDYMKSAAVNLGKNSRYFHLLWESALCHSFVNRPVAGDGIFLETLKWFKENNYLNNTALILMSDHGMRYEKIRNTLQGKVEAQTPFLFFVLPDWFQEKYPKAAKNLRDNKFKLVTAFDIHWTLRDLLTMTIEDQDRRERNTSQFGQSLFLPISNSRDCREAGIPQEFCSCQKYQIISTDLPAIKSIAGFVVAEINTKLQGFVQCARLKESRVLSAYQITAFGVKTGRQNSKRSSEGTFEDAFMVSLTTSPGNATFEAEVGVSGDKQLKLLGQVKRINKYSNQSHCVHLYELKPYCFCKDLLAD